MYSLQFVTKCQLVTNYENSLFGKFINHRFISIPLIFPNKVLPKTSLPYIDK